MSNPALTGEEDDGGEGGVGVRARLWMHQVAPSLTAALS